MPHLKALYILYSFNCLVAFLCVTDYADRQLLQSVMFVVQVLRDGINKAESHRGIEAEGGDQRSRQQDCGLQEGMSVDICLGNTRPSAFRRRLHQR